MLCLTIRFPTTVSTPLEIVTLLDCLTLTSQAIEGQDENAIFLVNNSFFRKLSPVPLVGVTNLIIYAIFREEEDSNTILLAQTENVVVMVIFSTV